MSLSKHFDAVVMLTWSDWKTEPRSNRYHFATRFARELPVLFVQPWGDPETPITLEKTAVERVEIVHSPRPFGESEVEEFLDLLRARSIRRPLLWIYNGFHFQRLINAVPKAFRVYHATEDYFNRDEKWRAKHEEIEQSLARTLIDIDLLVAVTEGVLLSYQQNGAYRGPTAVIENGCDAQFYLDLADRLASRPRPRSASDRRAAIYQGGINSRVDFSLLDDVVRMLPEWDFWFCGRVDEHIAKWRELRSRSNVHYFGELDAEALGERMCRATIGLIPFHQDELIRVSLPLKAYEYVACGLPVISVPIDALRKEPDLFALATSADEFVSAMRAAVPTRESPQYLSRRREAANCNSYDRRFSTLCEELVVRRNAAAGNNGTLNMAVLYDDRWMHINTIREHVEAFRKYSRHTTYFVPVTGAWPLPTEKLRREIDLSLFDVLIVHYSVRLSLPDHLSEKFAHQIERHMGLKVLFIQDEYESTETARGWMERLQFDIVYTCVPSESRELVYPSRRFVATDFLQTLTGYVPEDLSLDVFAKPIRERATLIGYRGRKLPYLYGQLGYEKYRIGVDVRRLAEARNLTVDIEMEDSRRIYGTDWYQFLGSVRATLGTESGSNVLDIDGTLPSAIKKLMNENPRITFEEVHRRVLAEHEGQIRMNQVSPKVFEAIRLRTALVLFEGKYSGAVEPDVHYIPLKKDYSNIDAVFAKLQDIDFLEILTKRAYDDVISSGKYSYRRFVEGVDRDIDARVIRGARYELFSTPALARDRQRVVRRVLPTKPIGFTLSTLPFGQDLQTEQVVSVLASSGVNLLFERVLKFVRVRLRRSIGKSGMTYLVVRAAWRVLPKRVRRYVTARLF
jgi:glycosyltransferase involved in cell wall biosynthesis